MPPHLPQRCFRVEPREGFATARHAGRHGKDIDDFVVYGKEVKQPFKPAVTYKLRQCANPLDRRDVLA